jgi:DNA invertase Pin-like site-specific DNA recombinase
MTGPLAVVAYLRVSTQGQADNGHGLEAQEAACRACARMAGHDLVGVITERGASGDKAERPALAKALAMVKRGDADAILVYRLDRLARDLVLQEILLREVHAAGGVLISAAPGENEVLRDPHDPRRKLMRQMLGAFAEYEKSVIALRLAAGRAAKRASGGKGSGSYPFGWSKGGPVEREHHVLSVIKTMLAQGQTLDVVAEYLNRRPGHQPRHAREGPGRWWGQSRTRRACSAEIDSGPICAPSGCA